MKTSWFGTLAVVASLMLGSLASQCFGGDKGHSLSRRVGGPSLQRVSGQSRGGSLNAGAVSKIGGSPTLSGKISGGLPLKKPIVKPTAPTFPVKPPVVKPTLPVGPIKPPIVGPIGPIGPIKPPGGPIKPLPPICPPYCPPKCPPWNPGYCGPWYPLPGWYGCYRPCTPICVTLPTFVGAPTVVSETVVVESAAPAVAVTEVKAESETRLMQVPVGATLSLSDKNLGEKQGQVILQVDPLSVPAQVNDWKADQVNVTLPMFGLAAPTKAQIWLMRADGQVANMLTVELIPAKPQAEAAAEGGAPAATVTQK